MQCFAPQVYIHLLSHANILVGDHTLSAGEHALKEIVKEEGDDYFVFLLSDANLAAYGITSKSLATILLSDKRVNSYAIFIGGEEDAGWLLKHMPIGHGHVCMDTARLPRIFKEIFAQSLIREKNHAKL
jgi:hypothetical protein